LKTVAILQSNYIPWKGYFDIIAAVDEFIIHDDVQYTKQDWRNRNQIKTPQGLKWLTIPVGQDTNRLIRDVHVPNARRARHFDEIAVWLKPLYVSQSHTSLSQSNRIFIEAVCNYLDINTVISNSWSYNLLDGKTERVVGLCAQASATHYISGPAAKAYINENLFAAMDIKLIWFEYSGYPEYPQLWGEFIHGVTILDLLFNCGKDAPKYMKHVRS
jgi:hypothetical protein